MSSPKKRKNRKGNTDGSSGQQPYKPPLNRDDWPSDPDSSGAEPSGVPFRINPGDDEFPSHLGPVKQLYCKTGFNLAVSPEGKIYGTREAFHPQAVLKLSSVEAGEVRIKGREAGLYVTMDLEGKLIGKADGSGDDAVFLEELTNGYNRYLSKAHLEQEWYLAIKKSGRPKRGSQTAAGQNAVQFLPRPHKPP